MPAMSPVIRRDRAAAPKLARERERALKERDTVEATEVDRADLAILVELQRAVDVRRVAERHADGAGPLADRLLGPPVFARLRHEPVERLPAGDDVCVVLTPRHAVRMRDRERPGAEESPGHEGKKRSPARRRVIHRVCVIHRVYRIAWSGPRGRAP